MNAVASTGFEDLELAQKRFATRTQFQFSEDSLKYTVTDKEASATFTVSYNEISRDRDFLVERNSWLSNVGLLWLALGAIETVWTYTSAKNFTPSMWLFIGAACFGIAYFRTVRYTKIPTERGQVLVIDDGQKDRILSELESRRVGQLRRWHDFIDDNEETQRQRNRFQWLQRERVLSQEELDERLGRLDRLAVLPEIAGELIPPDGGLPTRALN